MIYYSLQIMIWESLTFDYFFLKKEVSYQLAIINIWLFAV